eukprot:CAMPEP_0197389940 /NCGR_PEP_ID=MMETSP1165-20131217/2061_1 /TAXON_ID=284809 /ORGANISM="Chrysocystis fragilis, Strain CCMP3189" /LENGTH=420 /DNA_ID=CAMNT_0042915393 /DNA_START=61 /DNA_END=1323 /DNA_ORIENTATION=-
MARAVAVLLVVGACGAAPSVPSSFKSRAYYSVNGTDFFCAFVGESAAECGPYLYHFSQDDEAQRSSLTYASLNPYAPSDYIGTPAEWFNFSIVKTASREFELVTGLCYPIEGDAVALQTRTGHVQTTYYYNLFALLPSAAFAGSCGDDCELWTASSGSTTFSYALDDRGVPLGVNITTPPTTEAYVFVTFEAGADETVADFDETACDHPPLCNVTVEPGVDSIYVFHPADNFEIQDQDVANILGDAFFVCEDLLEGRSSFADHDYQWITRWNLTHNQTYGQYRNCNGYDPPTCLGTNTFFVGREAALGLGYPSAGQCEENAETGVWYSLPSGGECLNGTQPTPNTCTWAAERIKTINSSCLFETHDFLALCQQDARVPFTTAAEAFRAAFDYDDPAQGGCPELVVSGQGALLAPATTAVL